MVGFSNSKLNGYLLAIVLCHSFYYSCASVSSGDTSQRIVGKIEEFKPLVVLVNAESVDHRSNPQLTYGAGLIIGESREYVYIITASHVIKKAHRIRVRVYDTKRLFTAQVIHDDSLKIGGLDLSVLSLEKKKPGIGKIRRQVYCIPSNNSLRGHDSFGIGSSGDDWADWLTPAKINQSTNRKIIFERAPEPGYSGGPLFNGQGRALGIIISQVGQNNGLAIPMENIIPLVDRIGIPILWHSRSNCF